MTAMEELFDAPPVAYDYGGFPDDDMAPMKVGHEKEIGKQGLKKKLIKKGNGLDTPENGDEVEGFITLDHFSI